MYCTSIVCYNESYSHKDWRFENIIRPFNIIYYIYGGKGYYKYDGATYQFKKGYLYILPANKPFSLFQDADSNLKHLYIHAFAQPAFTDLLSFKVDDDRFLGFIVEIMKKYIMAIDTIYIKNVTEMLFSYISELTASNSERLSLKIKKYIDDNFLNIRKDEDLSLVFNYSNSYLTKAFKTDYKITPKQYYKNVLLGFVIKLLKENMPIKQISEILNFSSPENFSRFFKKNYGCSPREYSKNLLL